MTLVTTRRLKALSVFTIQWYYAVASCLVTGVSIALFQDKKFRTAFTDSTWQEWLLILVIGVLNNLGQNLSTWINQRANPATVGILMYFGVSFAFFFDILLFNISFTALELVGVSIVVVFTLSTAIYKQ